MFQPLAFPAPPPRVASLRNLREAGKPKEKLRKPIKTKENHKPRRLCHMFQPPAFEVIKFTWFSVCFLLCSF